MVAPLRRPARAAPRERERRIRRRFPSAAVCVALITTVSAGLFTTPAAAATRTGAVASLPNELWGVEVRKATASELAPDRLQRLRASGVNALVLDRRRLTWLGVTRLNEVAVAQSLLLVVAFPEQNRPARGCRELATRVPQAACAVLARDTSSARRLARSKPATGGAQLVVVRLASPTRMPSVIVGKPTRRVVGLAKLRSTRFTPTAWRKAITLAARNGALDLGVAATGPAATRRLDSYLRLLSGRQAPAAPTPGGTSPAVPPARPPAPGAPSPAPAPHPSPAPSAPAHGSVTPAIPPPGLPAPVSGPVPGTGVLAVAPNGDDATCARGDRSRPCRTFGRAYALALPGDGVDVACGTYPTQTVARNGRTGAVAIRAVTPHCAVVNGWLTLGVNNGSEAGNAPDYLTIDGVDVVDGSLFSFWNGGGPSRGLTLRNMLITDISSAVDLISVGSWDGLTIENVELGPACCQAVGLAVGRGNFGDPLNRNITISGLYIHDLSDTCAPIGGACSGIGFGSGCSGCRHIDGIQVTDAHDIAITNTRIERLSGSSGQGIFFAPANGGTFSNILLKGNTVGNLPQDDIAISGPGNGIVSGYLRIVDNTSAGNIIVYGSAPNNQIVAPGTEVVFSGNTGDLGTSNEGDRCVLVLSNGSLFRPTWIGNLNTARNCDG